MTFLHILSTVLLLVAFACFSYQAVYLILPFFQKSQLRETPKRTRYAVVIAARNEEAVLPHLLQSIAAQDYPKELITTYVIADNCSDRTAAVAAKHGAIVYQRYSTVHVGKGYALNYLFRQIKQSGNWDKYDAFLIFDADNLLATDYISQIDKVREDGYDVFCGYRNSKNFGDSWVSSGHSIWYLHESAQLNQSRMILGNCCAVSGTGFGFNRQLLDQLGGWNFFTLTEDIEFRTWCATHGIRIGYCHDAVFFDEQPTTLPLSVRQRTRWVQGGVQVSLRYALDYLRGIRKGGRTGWASFESATLSLWGYGLSGMSFALRLLVILQGTGWKGLAATLLLTLVTSYFSIFMVGAMTMALEHRRVRATRQQKIQSLFTYPIFVLTYLPISVYSLFAKRQWKPIAHTAVLSLTDL